MNIFANFATIDRRMIKGAFFCLKMKTIVDNAQDAARIDVRETLTFHLHEVKQRACRRLRNKRADSRPAQHFRAPGRDHCKCPPGELKINRVSSSFGFRHSFALQRQSGSDHSCFAILPRFDAPKLTRFFDSLCSDGARLSDAVSAGIELQTAGRPGAGDREADEVARGGKSASDLARCHRLGKNIHYRKRDPGN
jgi:hypothetical protein